MEGKSISSNGNPRRRPPMEEEEIEEGEIHRGGGYYDSGSETEDDDEGGADSPRYVFQPRRDADGGEGVHPAYKRRRVELEDILAAGRGEFSLPSPTPSSESEGTISDHGEEEIAVVDAAPVKQRVAFAYPCRFCNKVFASRKAVDGHMRVHQGDKVSPAASSGKRRRAVTVAFAPKEEVEAAGDNSMAIVLAEHALPMARPLQPQPIAIAGGHHHHALALMPGSSGAAATAQGEGSGHRGPPYRCTYEGCNQVYKTHQGLGGHVAGHINREKAAAAAASGGGNGGDGGKAEGKKHRCKVCEKEFLTGVALGGHMRKHYEGKVIVNKKKQEEEVYLDLTFTLAQPGQVAAPPALPPPVEPKKEEVVQDEAQAEDREPVPAPANGRRTVRIFGVDIDC